MSFVTAREPFKKGDKIKGSDLDCGDIIVCEAGNLVVVSLAAVRGQVPPGVYAVTAEQAMPCLHHFSRDDEFYVKGFSVDAPTGKTLMRVEPTTEAR